MVLRAPLLLGVCEDFILDASGSYGAAGRRLKFAYGMLPNVPNEQIISYELERFTATGDNTEIFLSGELLAIGFKYTFAVRVKNFLGVQVSEFEASRRVCSRAADSGQVFGLGRVSGKQLWAGLALALSVGLSGHARLRSRPAACPSACVVVSALVLAKCFGVQGLNELSASIPAIKEGSFA